MAKRRGVVGEVVKILEFIFELNELECNFHLVIVWGELIGRRRWGRSGNVDEKGRHVAQDVETAREGEQTTSRPKWNQEETNCQAGTTTRNEERTRSFSHRKMRLGPGCTPCLEV